MKFARWLAALFILTCGASLAGCAVSRQISGPDGETLYAIECSGYMMTMGSCLEKAGKICGDNGYELLMGGTTNHGNAATFGQFGVISTPIIQREIVVRCKNLDNSKN